jgi:hypothetical protein
MKSFDLNLEHYRKEELEEILQLPSSYDLALLEKHTTGLTDSLYQDPFLEEKTRRDTVAFLQKAKQILSEQWNRIVQSDLYNLDHQLRVSDTVASCGSYFIIDRKPTPYSQSFPSEFYPGVINPLKQRVLTKNLCINMSKDGPT